MFDANHRLEGTYSSVEFQSELDRWSRSTVLVELCDKLSRQVRRRDIQMAAKADRKHAQALSFYECKPVKAYEGRTPPSPGGGSGIARRLASCGRHPHGQTPVRLVLDNSTGRAHIQGLKVCGSVWCCPTCAERICAERKDELDKLLQQWRAKGINPYLMTLTFRHTRRDDLAPILEQLKNAIKTMRQHSTWRNSIIPVHDGSVTATEVTYGDANGWHPHIHILIGLKDISAADGLALLNSLRSVWKACGKGQGLDTGHDRAFDVRGADRAGEYVAKFGAAGEMSLGQRKMGRMGSMTPWQLLRVSREKNDAKPGRNREGHLWIEFAKAFEGKRQLVWSNGLKKRYGIAVRTDEDAAEASPPSDDIVVLREWTPGGDDWYRARMFSVLLVHAAETGGDLDVVLKGPTDFEWWSLNRRPPKYPPARVPDG